MLLAPAALLLSSALHLLTTALSTGQVRMANLAIVGSSHVNGVASIHTEILRSRVFLPFAQLFPDKFLNITNGVTQVCVELVLQSIHARSSSRLPALFPKKTAPLVGSSQ
jgi:glucan phosphorylase